MDTMTPIPHEHDWTTGTCQCGDTATAMIARLFETLAEQVEYTRKLMNALEQCRRIAAFHGAHDAPSDAGAFPGNAPHDPNCPHWYGGPCAYRD